MRERVWAAANVKLEIVTIDTDTTVHTPYGQQMGGRKGYKPEEQGQEELPADLDVFGRDAGIHLGRATQMAIGRAANR